MESEIPRMHEAVPVHCGRKSRHSRPSSLRLHFTAYVSLYRQWLPVAIPGYFRVISCHSNDGPFGPK
jgi:hypothetical protein